VSIVHKGVTTALAYLFSCVNPPFYFHKISKPTPFLWSFIYMYCNAAFHFDSVTYNISHVDKLLFWKILITQSHIFAISKKCFIKIYMNMFKILSILSVLSCVWSSNKKSVLFLQPSSESDMLNYKTFK